MLSESLFNPETEKENVFEKYKFVSCLINLFYVWGGIRRKQTRTTRRARRSHIAHTGVSSSRSLQALGHDIMQ